MRPPYLHSNFFSSLKQVEKRLKLESPTQSSNVSPLPKNTDMNDTLAESLSTPMYIYTNQKRNSTALQDSSEPPLAFLSSSPQSPPLCPNPAQKLPREQPTTVDEAKSCSFYDIDLLMQLLGMSDFERGNQNQKEIAEGKAIARVSDGCCECKGGFYEKIVGVKGPKCKREVERLDGWICYFLQRKMEPLRLVCLLLGKAAFEFEGGDDLGLAGFEFPLAIEEFLKYDPPRE